MAKIGSLFVNLALQDASFRDGLKRAARQTEQTMGTLERATHGAMKAFKALGGAAVVGGLVAAGRQILSLADNLQTAADRAGMSAEAYQRTSEALRALELSGDQTDKVLEKLVATLGEAQAGTAARGVAEALRRMGLEAKIASGEIRTTSDLLDGIARASDRYASRAQYAADVTALVGDRLGVKLATALQDGGVAYRGLADAAKVASDAQVAALARANEALERLRERFSRFLVSSAGSLVIFLEQLRQAGARIGEVGGGMSGLEALRQVRREADLNARFSLDRFGFGRALPAAGEIERRVTVPARRAAAATLELGKGLTAAAKPARLFDARSENFAEVAARLTEAARGEGVSTTAGAPNLADLAATLDRRIPNLSAEFEKAADFAGQLSRNLGQAIVNGQGIGRALVQSFKAAAAEAISSGLLRLLIGDGKSGMVGGLFGSVFKKLGGLFGGFRADGGPVSRGRAYMVGERGPELFVPGRSGTILPNAGPQRVLVDVAPSPLFVVTVREGAFAAGTEGAAAAMAAQRRGRLPGSRR